MIEEDDTSRAAKSIGAAKRATETVLVVEDEDAVRRLFCRILQSYGYAVLEASKGGEALAMSQRHDGPIHLLLADVVLPQMSGPQLAERLRLLRPGLKVLFTSGHSAGDVTKYGVLDAPYIQKPFSPKELQRKVREVLDA